MNSTEYQFLVAIIGENIENSPYQIINCPAIGIDIFFPDDFIVQPFIETNGSHTIIDMGIKVRLLDVSKYNLYHYMNLSEFVRFNTCACPFILTANANILNTPLRITDIGGYNSSNIDTIKLGITNLSTMPYTIRKNTSIAKLSRADLYPIKMKIVYSNDAIFSEFDINTIVHNNVILINNELVIPNNNENNEQLVISNNNENNNEEADGINDGINSLNLNES